MRLIEAIKLSPEIAGESWRRIQRRFRKSLLQSWRLRGPTPDAFIIAPPDLRPVDPALAKEFYAGRFSLGDGYLDTGGDSPFTIAPPTTAWQESLHSFRWLRHLQAADTELARAQATSLMVDWINIWGNQISSRAWQSEILSARLIAWCAHSAALSVHSPEATQSALRRSMARQARHLQALLPAITPGWPRLHATIALAHTAVTFGRRDKALRSALRDLDKELGRHILQDGGPASRNPSELVLALTDLLPLQTAMVDLGETIPGELVAATDRMAEALRFLQHSNGEIAQFNGTGATPHLLLALLLGEDLKRNSPQQSAPFTGYERLSAARSVVLMDTGAAKKPVLAGKALASTLAFELSSGKNLFVMNCGVPDFGFDRFAPFACATAAQSSAVIADTSSSHYAHNSRLIKFLPSALIEAPQTVISERREGDGFEEIIASHDGYADQFGLLHRRSLQLAKDGNTLNGTDRFENVGKSPTTGDGNPVTLRFHLPPNIAASLLANGHSIMLAAPDREAWTFTCVDAEISLMESIRFTGPGEPRKTEQIVVSGFTGRNPEIRWTLTRRLRKTTSSKRKADTEMPDLLSVLDDDGAP